MANHVIDHSGSRVGLLSVTWRFGSDAEGRALWSCVCDCGSTVVVKSADLKRARKTSCGCATSALMSAARMKREGSAQDYIARHTVRVGECDLWIGHRDKDGYGVSFYGGRKPAHRLTYETAYGLLDDPTLLMCHKCDNPPCVRPDHLFPGTCKDNLHDALRKGRFAVRAVNGNAKLSVVEAAIVAASSESGPRLAERYGVARQTINRIKRIARAAA